MEDDRSVFYKIIKPQRVNRLQFLLFCIISFLLAFGLSSVVPELWVAFFVIAIPFYMNYAKARVADWGGDQKAWSRRLWFCFFLILVGLLARDSAMLVFAAMIALLVVFISTLEFISKRGNGDDLPVAKSLKSQKELWALKGKKKKLLREQELKNLRAEVDELERTSK